MPELTAPLNAWRLQSCAHARLPQHASSYPGAHAEDLARSIGDSQNQHVCQQLRVHEHHTGAGAEGSQYFETEPDPEQVKILIRHRALWRAPYVKQSNVKPSQRDTDHQSFQHYTRNPEVEIPVRKQHLAQSEVQWVGDVYDVQTSYTSPTHCTSDWAKC